MWRRPAPQGLRVFFLWQGRAADLKSRFALLAFGLAQGEFPSWVPVEPINLATGSPGFAVPNQYLPFGTPTILCP
jgi:hypothetical protein